jgi:PhzF family phenazine biosynthesis protein
MRFPIFQLDAFTSRRFGGNPAAVVLFQTFPHDSTMLAVAAENNLAETAFLVPEGDDFRVRWFTPRVEVPLCGHATLASAALVMERLQPGRELVTFHSASGPLTVRRTRAGYSMNFPARRSTPTAPPAGLVEALGAVPSEVLVNDFNYMAVLESEQAVRQLTPDMTGIARLDRPGVIVTAAGQDGYDFISRYFAPVKGIPEDPVTGAAHCMLAPYWAQRLGKTSFRAFQASPRGGEVVCRYAGDRVELEGKCVFYLEGEIEI